MKSALAIALLLLVPLEVGAKPRRSPQEAHPKRDIASPAKTYEFLLALLDGYGWAKSAGEREEARENESKDSPEISRQVDALVGVREATRDFQTAQSSIAPYLTSDIEAIALAAKAADASYSGLVNWNRKRLQLMEELAEGKPGPQGNLVKRMADIKDGINQSWKILPLSATAASHAAFIPRKKDEKEGKLNLTATHQEALIKKIDKDWGESVQGGPRGNTHALTVSVAMIRQFISESRIKLVSEPVESKNAAPN